MLKVHAREWIGPAATTYLLKVFTQQHILNTKLGQKQHIQNKKERVFVQSICIYNHKPSCNLTFPCWQNLLENQRLQKIARAFDWFILPIANPDGYGYSRQVHTGKDQNCKIKHSQKTYCNFVPNNELFCITGENFTLHYFAFLCPQ